MDIERNKQIVRDFLKYAHTDVDRAFALFADDATVLVPGDMPGSGVSTKEEQIQHYRSVPALFEGGLMPELVLVGMTAEGDRVAVEAKLTGRLASGALYDQRYHLLFEVRDGKITACREYYDTDLVRRVIELEAASRSRC
jgi:ketosteroid isomerase-like protein